MFILTYIKAWGFLVPPIFCAWLFICMIIRNFFLKWDSVRGEYIMPEKRSNILTLAFCISTILFVIGVSIWCWYIADDVLKFFSGLKGE